VYKCQPTPLVAKTLCLRPLEFRYLYLVNSEKRNNYRSISCPQKRLDGAR